MDRVRVLRRFGRLYGIGYARLNQLMDPISVLFQDDGDQYVSLFPGPGVKLRTPCLEEHCL